MPRFFVYVQLGLVTGLRTFQVGGSMFQRIAEFEVIVGANGQWYRPRVYGDVSPDGLWGGFVVFFPLAGGNIVSTPRETTQSSYAALKHWALALDSVYLEGALARALNASAGVPLPTVLVDLATAEASAAADAIALHRAAERAGIEADSETRAAEMHEEAAAVARENAARLAREQEELEELADEATRADAEAAASAHESVAREARSIAAEAARRKGARSRARRAPGGRKKRK
jgi:hypothetical protein